MVPTSGVSGGRLLELSFHAFGVYFRAIMGKQLPAVFREACCTSAGKWIAMADCEKRMLEGLPKT
jgi:hypothetical protein